MTAISTQTKLRFGTMAAKGAAKNPVILKLGAKGAKPAAKATWSIGRPIARRRAKRRSDELLGTVRELGESLLTYGAEAAVSLGLVEPPAPRPVQTVSRVLAGAVVGATTVYLFEPGAGRQHRRRLARLVS